jgi:hypothetical protein
MSPHRRNPWFHYLKWGDFLLAGLISVLAVILLLAMPRAALPAASAALTMDGKVLQQWTAAELTASGEQDLTANGYHYQIARTRSACTRAGSAIPVRLPPACQGI